MQPGLHIDQISVRLRDQDRVFDLVIDDVTLLSGQAVNLTGASGSGKTLALEVLGLLRQPETGSRFVIKRAGEGDVNLAGLWANGPRNDALAKARGDHFGFVPQTGGLIPFLTVAENVSLPQKKTGRVDPDRCKGLIRRLGLSEVSDFFPCALSIGQRQRTSIARSLSHRPAFVIADEPTAALDPETADVVLELFLDEAREQNCGVILASHDRERMERFEFERWQLTASARTTKHIESALEVQSC